MGRTAKLGTVLVVVAVGVWLAGPFIACFVIAPIRQRVAPPGRAAPSCGPDVPALAPVQAQAAVDIALADPRVHEVLAGTEYEVDADIPWTAGTCLVGAVPHFRLHEPVTVAAEWPSVRFDEANDRPIYPPDTRRLTVHDMAEMHVFVDLDRREVVSIMPGLYSDVEESPSLDSVLFLLFGRITHCPE